MKKKSYTEQEIFNAMSKTASVMILKYCTIDDIQEIISDFMHSASNLLGIDDKRCAENRIHELFAGIEEDLKKFKKGK